MTYKEFLEANRENADFMLDVVREVIGYQGGFEDLDVSEFDDEFFNVYFDGRPMEAARATFFGNIENWQDEYIRFNGYGNLESLTEYQLHKEVLEQADDIITEAVGLLEAGNIDIDWLVEQYANGQEVK